MNSYAEPASREPTSHVTIARYPPTMDTADVVRGAGCVCCPLMTVTCGGLEQAWWSEHEWEELQDHLGRIEALLTARGVNYATQIEVLGGSSLFGSLRHGAGFYVTAAQAEYCRDALAQAGFSSGIVHDAERFGE